MEPKYWAGGWWGQGDNEPTIDDLIRDGYWKIGWGRNENNIVAPRYYKYLDNEMNIGDGFALKGMAGRKSIRIYAIGQITGFENDEEGYRKNVIITWGQKDSYLMSWPKGQGTGNWTATLLKILDTELINSIFNSDKKRDEVIDFFYFKNHTVKNYYSIENIELKNLDKTKEIFFLGENNHGKTLVLQSLFISLYGKAISKFKKIDIALLEQCIVDNEELNLISVSNTNDNNQDIYFDFKSVTSLKWMRNIFGYGVNRNRNSNGTPEDDTYASFMTLFDDSGKVFLRNPEAWLKDWDYWEKDVLSRDVAREEIPFGVEDAKKIIQELIEEEIEITVNPSGVLFRETGYKVGLTFENFSAGYKNLITWVCDLFSRLQDYQPDVRPIKSGDRLTFNYKGIVLVDEVDLHIHPKWAITIIGKLRRWFPEIQFFFTTHNPIVILGASDDAVIYKVHKEKGITKISNPIYSMTDDSEKISELSFRNLRVDQLVDYLFEIPTRNPRIQAVLKERRDLLAKDNLTSDEEKRIAAIEKEFEGLVPGETKEDIKMNLFLRKFAAKFKD